jgi:uncharacterized protein
MPERDQAETSKTKTCTRQTFDTRGIGPYYTRPMAAGLPDTVDCARLAGDGAELERTYELRSLPRIKDVLAEPVGVLNASFVFSNTAPGRAGAHVEVRAAPVLVCQRCTKGFAFPVSGGSDVEFTGDESEAASGTEREAFHAPGGRASLRDLAEEELLLALPIVPACDAPGRCGNAPSLIVDAAAPAISDDVRRPFGALQDLLKKDRT